MIYSKGKMKSDGPQTDRKERERSLALAAKVLSCALEMVSPW